jgi:hypothetical protein
MARKDQTLMVCETGAIPAHYTPSIGPLPICRGDTFSVTAREADAYELFGMARRATAKEIADAEALAAFQAESAAESASE